MKKIVFGLLLICSQIVSGQCAMCRAVVENGNVDEAEGLNTGILYLMVFPYLLVGTLFYLIIRYRKKLKI